MEKNPINKDIKKIIDYIYRDNSCLMAFSGDTAEEFMAWQDKARKRVRKLLSVGDYEKAPSDIEVVEETKEESFTKKLITYSTMEGLRVPAYLLIPKKLPAPAVLCPPGHGGGISQLVLEKKKKIEGIRGAYKQYPVEMVKRGYITMVPENIGFGLRGGQRVSDDFYEYNENHDYFYKSLNLLGKSSLGFMVWELTVALDILSGLKELDKGKIGCMGLSLGGELTLLLSAVDKRISAASVSGYFGTYQDSYLAKDHCGCGYIYGLAKYFEKKDIAALIAPRYLLMESAKDDPLFSLDVAEKAFKDLNTAYRLLRKEKKLSQSIFDGVHEIGDSCYNFFKDAFSSK